MGDRVGIVIPAYEADPTRLGAYINRLNADLSPAQIHVEVDRPTDAVLERLAETSASIRVSGKRRGKGSAITAGFDQLDTDVLAFVDADGSTPPSSLVAVLEPVLTDDTDLAVGSRRHPDATVPVHQSRVRRRLGDLFVAVARRILPVSLYDYQCGAKAINRETWDRVRPELRSPGFAWDIELICLVAASGSRLREVPILWEDRPGSTVPPVRAGFGFARALLRGWHRGRIVRGSRLHQWIDRVAPRSTPLVERTSLHGQEPGQ